MKKLDMKALTVVVRNAHLEECLAVEAGHAKECRCITNEEHQRNLEKARELGLSAS